MRRFHAGALISSLVMLLTSAPLAQREPQPAGAARAALEPGQTFKECPNCPEMVVVPAGSFVVGSPADEPERRSNEPQVTRVAKTLD